ncbi:helix-turn-helix domain-containing protein [Actinomycetaceae bacterium MB13-C1-2]|nr:helix-turn-helix domain-containing protein [Actinomycetaceae bacterium MB13-C1-2]
MPTETERAIVAEYQAGQTMKAIATKHSIHRVTVSEVLDRTGTPKRPKGMSPSEVDMAARLYESGLSLASVGAQLNFDATTIRTMLLRSGIATRDSHGRY